MEFNCDFEFDFKICSVQPVKFFSTTFVRNVCISLVYEWQGIKIGDLDENK